MYKFFLDHWKKLGVITLISFVLILVLTYLSVQPSIRPSWNYSEAGQIGDTFGGIAGTIVAFIAAIMALCAFWSQYEANESLAKSNDLKQIKDSVSEHTSILSFIKLYDREDGGAGFDVYGASRSSDSSSMLYTIKQKDTLLREGSEALFTLYENFFYCSL